MPHLFPLHIILPYLIATNKMVSVADVNFVKDSWKMATSMLNTRVYISTQHRKYHYMRYSTDTECSEWDG